MFSLRNLSDQAEGVTDGIVAPVKGLNTETPLAGLSQDYAIKLDNWVCQPDAIVMRTGAEDHVTGFGSTVKNLMVYSSGTDSDLFAATDSGIYNATTAGVVGAAVTALTKGSGKHVNFATSAGQFLMWCNGLDNCKLYDGTTWETVTGASAHAITGPATTTFFDVETYRARLYFLQNDYLGFYYLPADSVAGAATAFPIGSRCRLGGYVVAHGTWSIDAGSGPDDHYVLATSNGELVVFRGSNPGSASDWNYVGTFLIGRPLGQHCLVKFGGDLLHFGENGVIALSTLAVSTTRNYSQTVSSKIQPTLAALAREYGTLAGWKIFVHPKRSLVMLNIPLSSTEFIQYVYNSQSKAWSSFSGWNAYDFIEYEGEVYFSTGTKVAKAFVGTADFDADIVAICDTAYNRFKTRSQLFPILVRALFAATSGTDYTIGLAQDFTDDYYLNTYGTRTVEAGLWDSGLWDVALWGGGFALSKDWVTIAAKGGLALSTRFKISSKTSTVILLAVDYKFRKQGLVV